MPLNFNIALSHAFLAGTGIFCWSQIKNESLFCPHVTYSIIIVNNLMGFLWWMSESDFNYGDLFRFTSYCQLLFALPCITTTVWLQNGCSQDWSWAWAVVPVFPLLCYMMDSTVDMSMADLLILLNLVGLGGVSFIKEVPYGMSTTIAYVVAHWCLKRAEIRYKAMYNYVLCFFTYFSLRAIGFADKYPLKRLLE